MKLTKRGKKIRAILILMAVIVTVKGGEFVTTHHKENYNCRQIAEGLLCDFKWVKN